MVSELLVCCYMLQAALAQQYPNETTTQNVSADVRGHKRIRVYARARTFLHGHVHAVTTLGSSVFCQLRVQYAVVFHRFGRVCERGYCMCLCTKMRLFTHIIYTYIYIWHVYVHPHACTFAHTFGRRVNRCAHSTSNLFYQVLDFDDATSHINSEARSAARSRKQCPEAWRRRVDTRSASLPTSKIITDACSAQTFATLKTCNNATLGICQPLTLKPVFQ